MLVGLELVLVLVALDVPILILLILLQLFVGGVLILLRLILRQPTAEPAPVRIILVRVIGHVVAAEGVFAATALVLHFLSLMLPVEFAGFCSIILSHHQLPPLR